MYKHARKGFALGLGLATMLISNVGAAGCQDNCCGSNFSVRAEWLYWRPCSDDLSTIGEPLKDLGVILQEDEGAVIEPKVIDSDYESGFRVGVGYRNTQCCCWDLDLNWVNYSPKITRTKKFIFDIRTILRVVDDVNTSILIPSFLAKVKACWNVNLNIVDLELGYPFCINECFSIRPHLSIRYLDLEQTFKNRIFAELSDDEDKLLADFHFKQEFDGVGPRFGFDANWSFSDCYGIIGQLAVSTLCGDIHHTYRNSSPTIILFPGHKSKAECLRAVIDLAATAYYHSSSCGYEYDLFLGWETHYMFNQSVKQEIQLLPLQFGVPVRSDFATQGIRLGANVGF